MHDSVNGVHTLLGSRLRDARRGREGRIVGVDQTRPTPALLIVWEAGQGVERVSLSSGELRALVASSLGHRPRSLEGQSPKVRNDAHAGDSPSRVGIEPVAGGVTGPR
ncbi:hypothetical protein GCM10007160_12830 [Litchfieldella qijiaojingensis]|uniref:DUF2171 domain-containing protein n=1 Tax=Litchfieldella qijiaojingensis TaxID=980347 RepID=A0ABQ2YM76_9GAMM|nr:hypothetical protein [Halomonas qijiaojingensis]GGX86916.1 hypothetical protein GCM10007160_12830 [Halomonas qijiaojingensis]